MSRGGIYAIENLRNGRKYLGATADFRQRWRRHVLDLNQSLHANEDLQAAWIKFGEDAFRFVVIEEIEGQDALRRRERHWIEVYSKHTDLYNAVRAADEGQKVTYTFSVDSNRHEKVMRWLDRQPNRSGAVRDLIRKEVGRDVSLSDVYQAIRRLESRMHARQETRIGPLRHWMSWLRSLPFVPGV